LAPLDSLHVWHGAVHEMLLTPNGCLPVPDISFHHRLNPGRMRLKLRRNLAILLDQIGPGKAGDIDYFNLARTLRALGSLDAAERVLKALVARPGIHAEYAAFAHLYLSRLLFSAGDYRGAAEHAASALSTAPRLAEAACLLGDIALHFKERGLAARYYERAIGSGPCPVGPLFHEPEFYGAYPRLRLDRLRGRLDGDLAVAI
jgi:tetratricopeptide (TPR) repeat protein